MNLQKEQSLHETTAESLRVARRLVETHRDALDAANSRLEQIHEAGEFKDDAQEARLSRTISAVQEACRALDEAYGVLDSACHECYTRSESVNCTSKKRTASFHLFADGDVFCLEARDNEGCVLRTDELTERDEDRAIASAVRIAQKHRAPITFDI